MVLYKSSSILLFQVVFFIATVIEILLLSGITFGWASIEYVFQREGFFHYLCDTESKGAKMNNTDNSAFRGNCSTKGYVTIDVCSRQSRMFNLVFNVSLAFLSTTKFPIGLFVDSFGPRAGQLFGWYVPK